jgi:hypothetical protein
MELESGFEAVKATFGASLLDTLAAVLGIIPNFEAAERCLVLQLRFVSCFVVSAHCVGLMLSSPE